MYIKNNKSCYLSRHAGEPAMSGTPLNSFGRRRRILETLQTEDQSVSEGVSEHVKDQSSVCNVAMTFPAAPDPTLSQTILPDSPMDVHPSPVPVKSTDLCFVQSLSIHQLCPKIKAYF